MTEAQIINIIEKTLNEKLEQDSNFIRYTFFEIMVKYNLSKSDENIFDLLIENKLRNLDYKVYFRGEEYEYEGKTKIVEDNEILIAIKKVTERVQKDGRKTKKTKHW